jgi:signal transduction histidine kinase
VKDRDRQLRVLLDLGQIMGLDLKIEEMLLKIAQKAVEVMGADRCTLFLHDAKTDELWSTVALGIEGQTIRMPSNMGLAGVCFQSGKTIILEDAYKDPRFNREIDAHTGYLTQSILCVPIHTRSGGVLGVIQLLNKKDGVFDIDDETFLKTFGNHASIFLEIAQLQRARIEALEKSKKDLRRLNRAKDKALNHLSHELNTPLSIVRGTLRLLKRKLQGSSITQFDGSFDTLERHMNRLFDIQIETNSIIRSYEKLDEPHRKEEFNRPDALPPSSSLQSILLFPYVQKTLEMVKQKSHYRQILYMVEGRKDINVLSDSGVLREVLEGLLKNAIENTPDEGMICIMLEQTGKRALVRVQDFGIGITEANQTYIFDGFFTTQETDLYSSRKPYDFSAGGKGLELLRMKVYGERFGFEMWMESRRCLHLPTDQDLCPGKISLCRYCREVQDCLSSGGSTFFVSLPIGERED